MIADWTGIGAVTMGSRTPGGTAADALLPGDHVCHAYDDDTARRGYAADFIAGALSAGNKVLVLCHSAEPDAVTAELAADVAAFSVACGSGQAGVTACRDFYLTGGRFDVDRTMQGFANGVDGAAREGYSGLSVIADMTWVLGDRTAKRRLVDYEVGASPLFADRRMTAVCQYDRRRFGRALTERVGAAHPITPGRAELRFSVTQDPPGIRLAGQVDASNWPALVGVLTDVPRTDGPIAIDVSELSFADLSAVRALARTALGRRSHPTVLVCPWQVARVLDALGAGQVDGLTILIKD